MRPPIELPQSVTGFNEYYRLTPEADVIATALGYSLDYTEIALPRVGETPAWTATLQETLNTVRSRARLTSETARREFFISPIFVELARHYDVLLRAEFTLNVSERLRGTLDYLIETESQFLVVDAKNENMDRGHSQLVAEMAALDQWSVSPVDTLYGAVSTGTLWQFTALHRQEKRFEQDRKIFLVPDDLPDLCTVLLGVLKLSP